MKLILKNIGIIKNAEILLDDITVIAGENGSGKSTIGKVLCVLASLQANYEKYAQDRFENCYRSFEIFEARSEPITDARISPSGEAKDFKTEWRETVTEVGRFFKKNFDLVHKSSCKFSNINRNEISELRDRLEKLFEISLERLEEFSLENLTKKSKYVFRTHYRIMEELIRSLDNLANLSENSYFQYLVGQEFQGDIVRRGEAEASITIEDLEKYTINIKNDGISEISEQQKQWDFNSVAYVESPLLLQYKQALDQNKLILHNKELLQLLERASLEAKNAKLDEVKETIKGLLQGNFKVGTLGDVTFSDTQGMSFHISNLASGMKSFGILQLLLEKNLLDSHSLLVIDEPEVHLHPKWADEYTKIIVKLASAGIRIVIATHNPYIVKGIEYYGERADRRMDFYFADNNGQLENKNGSVEGIFESLSYPIFESPSWNPAKRD